MCCKGLLPILRRVGTGQWALGTRHRPSGRKRAGRDESGVDGWCTDVQWVQWVYSTPVAGHNTLSDSESLRENGSEASQQSWQRLVIDSGAVWTWDTLPLNKIGGLKICQSILKNCYWMLKVFRGFVLWNVGKWHLHDLFFSTRWIPEYFLWWSMKLIMML